jgi:RNA polymerase sigma factor (sigma-70 family)
LAFEVTQNELTLAKQIGWQVGRRWSAVEIEDLRSHLVLWLFEHPERVERFRTKENGKSQLGMALKSEALRYCTKEAAARQGKSIERNDFYSQEVVRRALPFMFEAGFETKVRQDPHTGKVLDRPFSTGDAQAIMADIKRAFTALPPQNQMVLELRYQDDLTIADVGKRLQISHQAIDQIVDKSIALMSQYLSR